MLQANLDPDETFIWDPDFPDPLNSRCSHKVYQNIDLESQDPRFNANLGLTKPKLNLDQKLLQPSHTTLEAELTVLDKLKKQ